MQNSNNISVNYLKNEESFEKQFERLHEFIYVNMSVDDYKKVIGILDNNERLLLYICHTYNAKEVLCSVGAMHLITNPNDLFIRKEECAAFLETFKSLVRTVLEEEDEDVANATTNI